MAAEDWYVVYIETNNGRRIGIDMDPTCSLSEAMSEEEASTLAAKLSQDMGIPVFDNNYDVWLGDVETK